MKRKILLLLLATVILSGCSLFKKNTVKVAPPPAIEVEAVPPSSAAKIPRNEEKEIAQKTEETKKECFITEEMVKKHCNISGEIVEKQCNFELKRVGEKHPKYGYDLGDLGVFATLKTSWKDSIGWEIITKNSIDTSDVPGFSDGAKVISFGALKQLWVRSGNILYGFYGWGDEAKGYLCQFDEAVAIAKEVVGGR